MVRLLGVVDGTSLTWEPSIPKGAPTSLGALEAVEFQTTDLFVVRSQDDDHPFVFTQYMSVCSRMVSTARAERIAGSIRRLAPSANASSATRNGWLSCHPNKLLKRYVFFTDPTYATTNLVITRAKGPSGFADVGIDCLGSLTGWRPAGVNYEVAHVDLVRKLVAVEQCGTSRHEAKSDAPFGIVVWGTDWFSSYGYPAGGNIGTINHVVIPIPK